MFQKIMKKIVDIHITRMYNSLKISGPIEIYIEK